MSRQPNLDDIPTKETMNPSKRFGPHWYKDEDGKNHRKNGHTEELLDAIKRKLIASVGRPYNDVYSEILPQLPERRRRSTWIDWFVELNCFEQDGKVYDSQGKELRSHCRDQLYVAEDGILKKVPHRSTKRKKPQKVIVELDKKKYYRHNDIWWEVETEPNSHGYGYGFYETKYGRIGFGTKDIFFGYLTKWESYHKYGESINIIKRTQCGKRICKKLNDFVNKGKK